MRYRSIFVVAILLATITTFSVNGEGVRGTTWGMSPEEVIRVEGRDYEARRLGPDRLDLLYPNGRRVLEVPALIGYSFDRDRLIRVSILWDRETVAQSTIIEILRGNYGEPYVDTEQEKGWWDNAETTYVVWRRANAHVGITYWERDAVERAWDEADEL